MCHSKFPFKSILLWERPPGREKTYNKVRQSTIQQAECGVDTRGREAAPT